MSYILINFNNYCNFYRKSPDIACTIYEDYVIIYIIKLKNHIHF